MSTFGSAKVTTDPRARVGLSRRTAIGLGAVVGMGGVGVSSHALAGPSSSGPSSSGSGDPVRAVAFDAFTVFDRQPAADENVFPGHGAGLTDAWSTRQFEHTWLRTLTGTYTDFWTVTRDALEFAAHKTGLELTTAHRERLMAAWLQLKAWPEAPAALREFKARGLRLELSSNATQMMLDFWAANSDLRGVVDPHLSTDRRPCVQTRPPRL